MGILLDERLRAVAELVRPGSVVADVGTDHGHLACHLVASRKCPRAFACDINQGPLRRARANILREGLDARILTLQCNGLEAVPCDAVGDIVIAGMGGDLIADIIFAWEGSTDGAKQFVLQPMTKPEHLRRRLYAGGFVLLDEVAVLCGGYVYVVMVAQYTGRCVDISHHFAHTGCFWDKKEWDDACCAYFRQLHGLCHTKARGYEGSREQAHLANDYRVLASLIAERLGMGKEV